jgi:hypothetical protein
MTESMTRIEVGFLGGGGFSGSVTPEQWTALRTALDSRDDLVEIELDAANVWLRPAQVAWVRVAQRETARVGFNG